jgi:acyl-CoA synthetase (AMP-forming)/AMP-acid ligase II
VQPVAMPANDAEAAALAAELIRFCRSQLADVKCPRSIDFRTELPRHPTGKLYKRLLKDEYWSREPDGGGQRIGLRETMDHPNGGGGGGPEPDDRPRRVR